MKTDVLVIGGSAAGLEAATAAKSNYPEKDVTIVRKESKVMIPCGIPYIFGTLGETERNVMGDDGLKSLGVNIIIDEIIDVDVKNKKCITKSGNDIEYERLIFATGSLPVAPKWLKGQEKNNVFTVLKNKDYLDEMMERLLNLQNKNIVVIGGGFIGVEMSDELKKKWNKVTLIEILPHIMSLAYDNEFAVLAEEKLKSRGVEVLVGRGAKEIVGDNKVEGVVLDNGETLEADAVIVSCGYVPNTELAKKAGIELNEYGFIKVDQYRRTANTDIFAVGDCSEKRDFSTGKLSRIMLASTACAESRVAGMNLYKLSTVKTFEGTIGIYSTDIGGTVFGVAGLTEAQAVKENFDVITGIFTGIDRHPGNIEGTHKQMVKLIVLKENGVVLGGEVYGGKSAGELINVIGFAIQNNMTINDFLVAQIGTQPMLTASPAGYPLIKAAENVSKKMKQK